MEKLTYNIGYAIPDDALQIQEIMHLAFEGYLKEIGNDYKLHALTETIDDILEDISKRAVYVAVTSKGKLIGAIRIKTLTNELAYVYRFGVRPDIKNVGVGSRLLATALDFCLENKFKAVALHTNTRFYNLARYYYGKKFFVHSTTTDKGYIRALFVKELTRDRNYDISPAFME